MAKKRASERVFAQFLRLSSDEQEEFVRLAWRHDQNALSDLKDEIASAGMDQMIAFTEKVDLELKLRRRTRKPSIEHDREIIHMKDSEGLSFGQIARRLGISRSGAWIAYDRANKRRSKPDSYRQ
jgi:DNA-directed RNA polymerase specialized sigma24 family protein